MIDPDAEEPFSAVLRSEAALALARAMPFLLSAFPTGVVFGALALAQGLDGLQAMLMSGFVYSGAAQFSGLQLIAAGATLPVILLVTLLLSLRFVVYGMALVDDIRTIPLALRMALAVGLADLAFFLVKARIADGIDERRKRIFFAAVVGYIYVVWGLGTLLGVLLGDIVAGRATDWGLDFFAYAGFVVLLAPYLRLPANVAAALAAFVLMALLHDLPHGSGLLLACFVAVTMVMIGRRIRIGRR